MIHSFPSIGVLVETERIVNGVCLFPHNISKGVNTDVTEICHSRTCMQIPQWRCALLCKCVRQ